MVLTQDLRPGLKYVAALRLGSGRAFGAGVEAESFGDAGFGGILSRPFGGVFSIKLLILGGI